MRRCVFLLVLCLSLSLFALTGSAQIDTLPGLILTDLHLISQESLPHWTPAWTGPIQGATIAAWFAEHGYPALLWDLNGDGMVDELDTIELADDFGMGPMRTETPRGTTDVRLALELGTYFANFYPDEFVLKIYDPSFPAEVAAQGYGPFAPDMVPGLIIEILEEPSIEAYIYELTSGEGIIVGLEEPNVDRNRYFSGRSFLYDLTPEGYTPLDFAWAKEDRWEEGHQGQVLETVGKMDDRFYVETATGWVPVEFMLALSPRIERNVETEEYGCPPDAIAYDVTVTSLGDYGQIQIEECVIREGDIDIYFWIVTNLSFMKDGCGLCAFRIPNPGLAAVGHLELPPWNFMSGFGSWIWWLPTGSCGLMPGQTSVFMVAVPGPTIDSWVTGAVAPCQQLIGTPPMMFRVETTGPGGPDDDPGGRCPDLMIRVLDESCVYDTLSGMYEMTIWADVLNLGSAPVTSPFDVLLTGTSHPGNDTVTITVPPVLPPGGSVPVTLSFTTPPDPTGGAPCPLFYEVMVDSGFAIDECDEANNLVYGNICCLGEPDDGEDCPDLTMEIRTLECIFDRKNQIFELTVTALLRNVGTQTVTDAIWTRMTSDNGNDSSIIHTDLAPGASEVVEYSITFSVNEAACPLEVTVEADYVNFIDECDEDNNEASDDVCCD